METICKLGGHFLLVCSLWLNYRVLTLDHGLSLSLVHSDYSSEMHPKVLEGIFISFRLAASLLLNRPRKMRDALEVLHCLKQCLIAFFIPYLLLNFDFSPCDI